MTPPRPPASVAGAAFDPAVFARLDGVRAADPVDAARVLDDADPIKRALARVPLNEPCCVHLFMRTPRYDKDGREVPVVLDRLLELGHGAVRAWTPYYMTGDHQEIVVRYDAVARVVAEARHRYKLADDGTVHTREAVLTDPTAGGAE